MIACGSALALGLALAAGAVEAAAAASGAEGAPSGLFGPVDSAAKAAGDGIAWWTIDTGGGTSVGGGFQVRGTIGQADASVTSSNATYSVRGGFWPSAKAVAAGENIFANGFEAPAANP